MRIIRPLRSRVEQWVSRPPSPPTGPTPSLIPRLLVVAAVGLHGRPGAVTQVVPPHPFVAPGPVRAALVVRLPARVVWERYTGGNAAPTPQFRPQPIAVVAGQPSARRGAILINQPVRLFMMMPGHGANGPKVITLAPKPRPGRVAQVTPPRPLVTFLPVTRTAHVISRTPPGLPGRIALVGPPRPLVRFSAPHLLQVRRQPPGTSGVVLRVSPPRLFVAPPLGSVWPAKITQRVPPARPGIVLFSRRAFPFVPPKPPPARTLTFLPPGRRGQVRIVQPPHLTVTFGPKPALVVRRQPPGSVGVVLFSRRPRTVFILTVTVPRAALLIQARTSPPRPRPVLILRARRSTLILPPGALTARIARRQLFPYPGGVILNQPVRQRVVPILPRILVVRRIPPGPGGSAFSGPVSRVNAVIVTHGNPRAKVTLRPNPVSTVAFTEG